MRNRKMIAAFAVTLMACPLHAQEIVSANDATPSKIASEASVQEPSVAKSAPCELHVWPSNGLGAVQNNFMGGGLIPILVAEGRDSKERNAIKDAHVANLSGKTGGALAPATQGASLAGLPLAQMFGLNGYTLIVHDAPLDSRTVRTQKTRYAASNTPCYADLVVSDNEYTKDFVNGRYLMTLLRFRAFGVDPAPSRTFGTWVKSGLNSFSLEVPAPDDAALRDVTAAFEHNIANFSQLVVNPPKRKK